VSSTAARAWLPLQALERTLFKTHQIGDVTFVRARKRRAFAAACHLPVMDIARRLYAADDAPAGPTFCVRCVRCWRLWLRITARCGARLVYYALLARLANVARIDVTARNAFGDTLYAAVGFVARAATRR